MNELLDVNFIAQLFIEKFFILAIIRICTTALISKFLKEYSTFIKEPTKLEFQMHEDNLEGLIKFYEQIGKIVDEKEKNKGKEVQTSKAKKEGAFDEFIKVFQAANNPKIEIILPEFHNEDTSLGDFFKMYRKYFLLVK